MSFITIMNLFLAICFVPLLPVIYFTMLNERKPKNNLILSTTIPKEAWEDKQAAVAVHTARGSQDRGEVGQRSWNGWCWKMLMVPGPRRWPGLSGQKPVGLGQE